VPFGQLYKHASNGTRLQKSEEYPCDKQFVNDSKPSFTIGSLYLFLFHKNNVVIKITVDSKNIM
jgi:hypothetical protein